MRLASPLQHRAGESKKALQRTGQTMGFGTSALLANRGQPWSALKPNEPLLGHVKLYYETYGYPKKPSQLKQQLHSVTATTAASNDSRLLKTSGGQAEPGGSGGEATRSANAVTDVAPYSTV